jgi:hypothetical protein
MVEQRVDCLKNKLQEAEEHLRNMCQSAPQWLEQHGLIPDWFREDVPVLEYKRSALMDIETHLDDYITDNYWFSSNFNADRERLQKAFDQSAREHGARLKELLQRACKPTKKNLQANADCLNSLLQLMQVTLANLDSVKQQECQLKELHETELKRMDDSRKLASHFESRLNQAFVEELRKTVKRRTTIRIQRSAFTDYCMPECCHPRLIVCTKEENFDASVRY